MRMREEALRPIAFRVLDVMGIAVTVEVRALAGGWARGWPEAGSGARASARAQADAERAIDAAARALADADHTFSRYRPGTPLSRYLRGEIGLAQCPPSVPAMIASADAYRRLTGGRFDARRPDGALDLDGVVKGWAIERAGAELTARGATSWSINAGGDVAVHGPALRGQEADARWRVGVVDPADRSRLLTVLAVGGARPAAVATSGTAERSGHVWDPRTGAPSRGLVSVTVVGPDIEEADVLATAVLAGGGDDLAEGLALLERLGLEGLAVRDDGELEVTRGLRALLAPS